MPTETPSEVPTQTDEESVPPPSVLRLARVGRSETGLSETLSQAPTLTGEESPPLPSGLRLARMGRQAAGLSSTDSDYMSESPVPVDSDYEEEEVDAQKKRGRSNSDGAVGPAVENTTDSVRRVVTMSALNCNNSNNTVMDEDQGHCAFLEEHSKSEQDLSSSKSVDDSKRELQMQLFHMINRVNRGISDLENKVTNLQLARTPSFTSIPSSIDSSDIGPHLINKDSTKSDVSSSFDDVPWISKTESEQSVDLTPQLSPATSNRDNTMHSQPVVMHRRSTPIITVSDVGFLTPGSLPTPHRDYFRDSVSVGSVRSGELFSEVEEVQKELTDLKGMFKTDSEQMSKMLMRIGNSSSC